MDTAMLVGLVGVGGTLLGSIVSPIGPEILRRRTESAARKDLLLALRDEVELNLLFLDALSADKAPKMLPTPLLDMYRSVSWRQEIWRYQTPLLISAVPPEIRWKLNLFHHNLEMITKWLQAPKDTFPLGERALLDQIHDLVSHLKQEGNPIVIPLPRLRIWRKKRTPALLTKTAPQNTP